MYELELFAGTGGGVLGKNLLGHTTVGAVEIEPYCRRILLQRQRDLCCPTFPIWDDVRTFSIDNPECAAYIDWLRTVRDHLCISGGFPCQDISSSGKGVGISGARSGLWTEMARIVGEIRPSRVFVENSPMLAARGLEVVLSSLAEMGYHARWCVLGAGALGYPIIRDRLWLLGMRDQVDGAQDVTPPQRIDPEEYLWHEYQYGVIYRMLKYHDCWPTVLLLETLMGWPSQWTAPQPLAMAKYLSWRRSHGGCSTAN